MKAYVFSIFKLLHVFLINSMKVMVLPLLTRTRFT